MHVIVEIEAGGPERPPAGSPIHVEAQDTALQDVVAETVGSAEGTVVDEPAGPLDRVEVEVERDPARCTIWVHVDVDGDGRISTGDYITMASYPVPPVDGATVTVEVRRI